MSTIAQLGVPAEEFALRGTLSRVPDVTVEAERVVAHDEERVMPFVWAAGDDLAAFEDALAEDPSVENERRLTDLPDGRFYRMEWVESVEVLLHSMTEHGAAVLKARGQDGRWHLRILFSDRAAVSQTHEFCRDRDLGADVEQIHELDSRDGGGRHGLTAEQYEAVTAALETGYYEVPRGASARDVADELDISHQALSERLRRGHGNLVANALTVDAVRDGEDGPVTQ
ncbi:helix-turn-helix domain-containing protein [Halorussus gelatinilyticus]|uniref:Helix-turn-helix domain-containing protein n=1 Tax=Halorussus gelatinilyticus TaxID=2937524 RepID=A0A8U0IKC6_9EURY|nr:bacterio-opsin activator domain-containing protein [Halorussus gelatinilyticus]UPW01208.1 helix-turn-helix domain-containing protein [Halorussus gelatinilyticus]